MGGLWRRLNRSRAEDDVSLEVEFHLEMRAKEFEATGMSPEAARRAAESSFGDVDGISARLVTARRGRDHRRRWRESWSGFVSDVRRAARMLRRDPGFSIATVLTLGVGVALVTAWAALATAYLVKPLPFPAVDRLVTVSGPGAPDWRDAPEVFEIAVSWDLDALSIIGEGRPQSVRTSWITAGWFELSGARAKLGRLFREDETGPDGRAVAVISDALWQTRWGGDPDVVGRTFTAYSVDRPEESEVFTIVGVLEPDFWFLNGFTEVLAPLRGGRPSYMARLRSGVSPAEAQAVVRRWAETRGRESSDVTLRRAQDAYVEQVRPVLLTLGGVVGLVLVIALGNALSLVLVRALGREREFAVRAAIGAGRGRVARQLLTEGLVLAGAAAVAGVVFASAMLVVTRDVVPAILGTGVPGGTDALSIDGRVLAVAVGACAVIGVTLALVPLIGLWRPALSTLREGGRGTASRGRQRIRSALVALELALSLALAVGAGLLLRSALHLDRQPLGFEPEGIVALEAAVRQTEFPEPAARAELFDRMETTIEREVPGLEATIASWAPLARAWSLPVETPERPGTGREDDPAAFVTSVAPDYFGELAIPLLEGRPFNRDDRLATEPVAIVSRALAERLWPSGGAVGGRIRLVPEGGVAASIHGGPPVWRTVVGVAGDVTNTLTGENPAGLYFPVAQVPPTLAEIILRAPAGTVPVEAAREAVWQVYPDVPLDDLRRLDEVVAAATLPARFLAWLVSAFGGFALALAAIGIYGVVAFAVNQSRRDVAIRIALGATGGRVAFAFVVHQAAWIGAGLLAGLAGAYALSSTLRAQLHGIDPADPLTWLAATTAVGCIALLATWVPARRAARMEPSRMLQGD